MLSLLDLNKPEVSLTPSIVPTTVNPARTDHTFLLKTELSSDVSHDISGISSECNSTGKEKTFTDCKKGSTREEKAETARERQTSTSAVPTPTTDDLASVTQVPQIATTFATPAAGVVHTKEVNRLIPSKVFSNRPLPTSQIVYIKPFSKTKILYHQKSEQPVTPSTSTVTSSKGKKFGKVESTTPSRIIYISLLPHPTKPSLQG